MSHCLAQGFFIFSIIHWVAPKDKCKPGLVLPRQAFVQVEYLLSYYYLLHTKSHRCKSVLSNFFSFS